MQITEIKIGELPDFIKSEQFKLFNPKPITRLRAISQFNNPDAKAGDTALIIAHENSNVVGFAGFLPRNANGSGLHVCSNSCWWADPEKGKGVALSLLFSGLKKYNSGMFLTDATPYSKAILEKTGYFEFYKPQKGVRGVLRFYFADLVTKKYKKLKSIKIVFVLIDLFLNFLLWPVRYFYIKKYGRNKLEFEPVTEISAETERFINAHSKNDFIGNTSATLRWIKKYPWVTEQNNETPCNYPFSHVVNRYELDYFELKEAGKLKAFVAFSVRDNLMKIPFIYFDEKDSGKVMHSVFWFILKKRYDSLLVFHPATVSFLNKNRLPFIYKKRVDKQVGITTVLKEKFDEKPILQDGDGDVIFT